MPWKRIVIAPGTRYGRLTIIGWGGMNAAGRCTWRCLCDCGTEALVAGGQLRAGLVKSCGCLMREQTRAMTKHGMHRSPEYRTWAAIIQRCHNPKSSAHEFYGGRGISVCGAWRRSFVAFYADIGPKPSRAHTLERVRNDGDYEPGNVRWATMHEQARNRRDNRKVEVLGLIMPLCDWAEVTGLRPGCMTSRLRAGWSPERAVLTLPKNQRFTF
jgi:ribosomal protein S16